MKIIFPKIIASVFLASGIAVAYADSTQAEPDIGKMQAQMQLMQKQMQQIQSAKTPEERQRLMQEHATTMREHMQTVCGGNTGKGHMMGAGGGMMDGCGGMRGQMMGTPTQQK